MDKKGEALKPVFNIPSFIQEEKELDVTSLTDDEHTLGTGANSAFWIALKLHINNQLRELEKINEAAIASGMSYEEIGKNTTTITLAKGIINKIFNIVEDAKEALEKNALEEAHGK